MITKNLHYVKVPEKHSYIFWMRLKRYLQTGRLLHLMTLAGIFMFWYFGRLALKQFSAHSLFSACLFTYLSLYGFTLPFFSQLDARSRYQNYKLLKDKLYEHGFDERLLHPFVFSRCQRDAIFIAAKEMQVEQKTKLYFKKMGFRWYHLLPALVVKNPRLLLTKDYWNKTLFVPYYQSKYFLC